MATLKIHRIVSLPATSALETSSLYITKNATNPALVDLTFVGDSAADIRKVMGQADVDTAVDTAIANLTAAQIPDLPGSKITSALSVDTTGKAATADKLTGTTINGVPFTGEAPITVPAVDTETPRVAVSDVGTSVAPLVDGRVPTEYLPLSLDQIDEYPTRQEFPAQGRSDVIYIAHDSGFLYRWNGTDAYVQLSTGGTGVADEANRLTTGRMIGLTGDASGEHIFDGSQAISIPLVLASVGAAGAQGLKVTTDAKGRVVSSAAATADDIPDLPGSKIISTLSVDTTGNAATATALASDVVLTLTGDAQGTATFKQGGAVEMAVTVTGGGSATTGATGTFTKVVTVDGLVTEGAPLLSADLPAVPAEKVTGTLSNNTTGNAATATAAIHADTAGALTIVAEW